MKKLAIFAAALGLMASCTKWENLPTEEKIAGLWNGVNTEMQIKAVPFLDSTDIMNTTDWVANFMENGGLTIDSAGVRLDSMGWYITQDTLLTLNGVDMGAGGIGAPTSSMTFDINILTQEQLVFVYDTTFSMEIDPSFPAITLELTQIQRWAK